jgi:hypothetical protein
VVVAAQAALGGASGAAGLHDPATLERALANEEMRNAYPTDVTCSAMGSARFACEVTLPAASAGTIGGSSATYEAGTYPLQVTVSQDGKTAEVSGGILVDAFIVTLP